MCASQVDYIGQHYYSSCSYFIYNCNLISNYYVCQRNTRFAWYLNSLRCKDTMWWHRIMRKLAQVMASCLTTPSHYLNYSRWRHQMVTFSALLAICAGNSPVPGEFPTQRPVTRSFDVYFDLRPDKRLNNQSWGWWFETLSHSLWRHRNVLTCNQRYSVAITW